MDDLAARFQTLDTTSVSDALDRLGLVGGLLGLKPLAPHTGRVICGQAFTVRYRPCGAVKGTVGDFLDDVPAGQVIVLDNGGRDYCTVWGDIMSLVARSNKVAGTIIDGVCRDVSEIVRIGYPVFSKGHYMVTGKDRVEVETVNSPVSVSGVEVRPLDFILADDSGALVIPQASAAEVLAAALEIAETERRIIEDVQQGVSLRASRSKHNYHHLQTKA